MKRVLTLICALGISAVIASAAASFKQFRAELKAAREAVEKNDFQKARSILEKSTANAESQGALNSAEHAYLLSSVYISLKMPKEADALVEKQLEKIGPTPKEPRLQYLRGAMLIARVRNAYFARDYDRALTNATVAMESMQLVFGEDDPELFYLHSIMGAIYVRRNELVQAEKSLKAALSSAQTRRTAMSPAILPEDNYVLYRERSFHPGIHQAATDLGELYWTQKRYPEAQKILKTALDSAEAEFGKNSPQAAATLAFLAPTQLALGKRKDFDRDVDRVEAMLKKQKGMHFDYANPLWARLELAMNENKQDVAAQTADRIANIFAVQQFNTVEMGRRGVQMISTNKPIDWARAREIQQHITKAVGKKFTGPVEIARAYVPFADYGYHNKQYAFAIDVYKDLLVALRDAPDRAVPKAAETKIAEFEALLKKQQQQQ